MSTAVVCTPDKSAETVRRSKVERRRTGRFDGHNWFKTDRKRIDPAGLAERRIQNPSCRPNPRRRLITKFCSSRLATNALFAPHQVRAVFGQLQGVEYDTDDSLSLRFPTARRLHYQVLSEIPERGRMIDSPDDKRPIQPKCPADICSCRQTWIHELRIWRPKSRQRVNPRGKSGDGRNVFKAKLQIHPEPGVEPGPQPVSTFLFDAKSGHCEYFASSMAILLRTAGIPTRLINGFLMGEYNPSARTYRPRIRRSQLGGSICTRSRLGGVRSYPAGSEITK